MPTTFQNPIPNANADTPRSPYLNIIKAWHAKKDVKCSIAILTRRNPVFHTYRHVIVVIIPFHNRTHKDPTCPPPIEYPYPSKPLSKSKKAVIMQIVRLSAFLYSAGRTKVNFLARNSTTRRGKSR
jgi:hypothetical protein